MAVDDAGIGVIRANSYGTWNFGSGMSVSISMDDSSLTSIAGSVGPELVVVAVGGNTASGISGEVMGEYSFDGRACVSIGGDMPSLEARARVLELIRERKGKRIHEVSLRVFISWERLKNLPCNRNTRR